MDGLNVPHVVIQEPRLVVGFWDFGEGTFAQDMEDLFEHFIIGRSQGNAFPQDGVPA